MSNIRQEKRFEMSYRIIDAMSILKYTKLTVAIWDDEDGIDKFTMDVGSDNGSEEVTYNACDKLSRYMDFHSYANNVTIVPILYSVYANESVDWMHKHGETAWLRVWYSNNSVKISTRPTGHTVMHS